LNVYDLNSITKCEISAFAVTNREDDCKYSNDQKHKGSSAEEEPHEHAISHIVF